MCPSKHRRMSKIKYLFLFHDKFVKAQSKFFHKPGFVTHLILRVILYTVAKRMYNCTFEIWCQTHRHVDSVSLCSLLGKNVFTIVTLNAVGYFGDVVCTTREELRVKPPISRSVSRASEIWSLQIRKYLFHIDDKGALLVWLGRDGLSGVIDGGAPPDSRKVGRVSDSDHCKVTNIL